MWDSMANWESLHIYSRAADDELVLAVAEVVETLIEQRHVLRWFFIRHSDDGHHLRVRIDTQDAELLPAPSPIGALDSLLRRPTGRCDRSGPTTTFNGVESIERREFLPDVGVYGVENWPSVEDHFVESTHLAVDFLSRRLPRWVLHSTAIYLLASCRYMLPGARCADVEHWFRESRERTVAESSYQRSRTSLEALVGRVRHGSLDVAGRVNVAPFVESISRLVDKYDSGDPRLPYALSHWCHLTLNRLGVDLQTEAQLRYFMGRMEAEGLL